MLCVTPVLLSQPSKGGGGGRMHAGRGLTHVESDPVKRIAVSDTVVIPSREGLGVTGRR